MADTSSARAYNSWWQFRSDVRSELEEASRRLANAIMRGQPADGMVEAASGLLDALAPIEQYWAFPGREAYRRGCDLFASADYVRFALMVARINRALETESYRGGSGWPVVDGDPDTAERDGVVAEQAAVVRPYFEVLVVETLTAAQEQALREEVWSWRGPVQVKAYDSRDPNMLWGTIGGTKGFRQGMVQDQRKPTPGARVRRGLVTSRAAWETSHAARPCPAMWRAATR